MKIILIELNDNTAIELSKKLESLGMFNLKRGNNLKPIAFEFIPGVTENPGYIDQDCHVWKEFDRKKMIWKYARLKVSEKGEKILNKNGIDYIYEKIN